MPNDEENDDDSGNKDDNQADDKAQGADDHPATSKTLTFKSCKDGDQDHDS